MNLERAALRNVFLRTIQFETRHAELEQFLHTALPIRLRFGIGEVHHRIIVSVLRTHLPCEIPSACQSVRRHLALIERPDPQHELCVLRTEPLNHLAEVR